jgi:hypothetical protein
MDLPLAGDRDLHLHIYIICRRLSEFAGAHRLAAAAAPFA